MKIKWRLSIAFSAIIVVTISLFSIVIIESVKSGIISQDLEKMNGVSIERSLKIQELHDSASEDLVFVLKNPKFVEYFELSESKAGNVYEDGILQFTDNQKEIKSELEQWVFHFQNKFEVDETCLIDTSGQEHTRLVLSRIETDENLSPEEASAPFFEPSFEKELDEVHIEYPYLSPDTHRWVFAYTSPVVLGDGTKPAFYHFEMPITIFQDMVAIDHGIMYVVDTDGHFIANSDHQYPTTNIPEEFDEFFPTLDDVFSQNAWADISQQIRTDDVGQISYSTDDETFHGVYRKLPTFDWYLFYIESESLIFTEHATVLGSIQTTITTLALIIMAASLGLIFWLSEKISSPILKLRDGVKEIQDGKIDAKVLVKGDDEINDLSNSFNQMTSSLKKTIELEKELAITQNKIKHQKLETIGELSSRLAHDLRNPLAVIQATLDLLRMKSDNLDDKTKERYSILDDSVKRMSHQIDHVLKFIKTSPMSIEKTSLYKLVDSAISSIKIPDGVTIEKIGNDIDIRCDKNLIHVVIINLISNAIHAINKNGQIKIGFSENSEKVIINVQDSGEGIADEDLNKIFDPLFTTKQEGTGLGLSSCKNIVEQHGGTISVKNNPTVFSVILPKRISEEIQEK